MASPHPCDTRSAGVLLHPTSLPSSESCWGDEPGHAFGTLGKEAYNFVDFMAAAGLRVWQVLPLVPTEDNLSPYQSSSVHAGNPDLISLDDLVERGWIKRDSIQLDQKDRAGLANLRRRCAPDFFQFIHAEDGAQTRQKFEEFCHQRESWLQDFALFCALRRRFDGRSWVDWPAELRSRDPAALQQQKAELQDDIDCILFEQFSFFTQWLGLKHYANEKGISLFGDIPIFVGHNSADVWAEQQYFQLDDMGNPTSVAGVPPDSFSDAGQCWGNPHYNWEAIAHDGFRWWLDRLASQMELFDVIRIDHFRGFDSVWAIPANHGDAREGEWIKTPGKDLLGACFSRYPDLHLVAENLGTITPDIEQLREQFHLPGMLVLHFAFENNSNSPHLPHQHTPYQVVYTGTHDNDTSLGWFKTLTPEGRAQWENYTFHSQDPMPWLLIDMAFASCANLAIIPMQDFLGLDSDCRMNTPGVTEKNWRWQFSWEQVGMDLPKVIHQRLANFHRLPD